MAMPTNNGEDYFVNDFYKRTLQIFKQQSERNQYDVTLTINLMMGMLVVPKEKFFNGVKIPDSYISKELLNKIKGTIVSENDYSFTQILRRLRNAVCHGDMEIKAEKPNNKNEAPKIGTIIFKDDDGFFAEIPVDLLKEFLLSFSSNVCNTMKNNN